MVGIGVRTSTLRFLPHFFSVAYYRQQKKNITTPNRRQCLPEESNNFLLIFYAEFSYLLLQVEKSTIDLNE